MQEEKIDIKQEVRRIIIVLIASTIMALNLNSFVHYGEIIPGGFNGITLLIQRLAFTFLHIEIPFTNILSVL